MRSRRSKAPTGDPMSVLLPAGELHVPRWSLEKADEDHDHNYHCRYLTSAK
jgi:hypothetical protein